MSVPAYITKGVAAIIAELPDSHKARVMDALHFGGRITTLQLAYACKVHRCTVWAWVRKGLIPPPRRDSEFKRSWDYSDVQHMMN